MAIRDKCKGTSSKTCAFVGQPAVWLPTMVRGKQQLVCDYAAAFAEQPKLKEASKTSALAYFIVGDQIQNHWGRILKLLGHWHDFMYVHLINLHTESIRVNVYHVLKFNDGILLSEWKLMAIVVGNMCAQPSLFWSHLRWASRSFVMAVASCLPPASLLRRMWNAMLKPSSLLWRFPEELAGSAHIFSRRQSWSSILTTSCFPRVSVPRWCSLDSGPLDKVLRCSDWWPGN